MVKSSSLLSLITMNNGCLKIKSKGFIMEVFKYKNSTKRRT